MAIFQSKLRTFRGIGKENVNVRKNLPPRLFGFLVGLVPTAFASQAYPAPFTRCEPVAAEPDCIPGSGGAAPALTNGSTINITKAAGTGDVVAFNWNVKNCLSQANELRGQVMVIVDNSKSELTTDVNGLRATVVSNFLQSFATKAGTSNVATGNASYPKLAVMNYNGRSGVEVSGQKVDDLNLRFDPDYCVKTTDTFPSAAATARWGTPSDATKFSICEFLPFVFANDTTAVANMRDFVDFATDMPRGSTDFTYFFKGSAKAYNETTNANNVGRNVVIVTDGLPNVPKNVAGSVCAASRRLSREPRLNELLIDKVQDYCVDRQAPASIAAAHSEALTAPFDEINVHHILFTQDQTAYFDYDDNGEPSLNPAGFLIENSARTGNGKVKFGYARNSTDLFTKLDSLFQQFDKNALRYVRVEVTPPDGSSKLSYTAVSPAAPGSSFSIKFVGLKTGTNQVKVTPVYQDGRSADTTINVVVGAATDADLKCSSVPEDRTVDGDKIGATDPKGDGFYAVPLPSGQYRDYRNADEGNRLASEFGVVGNADSQQDLTGLRLQGGTGNCGSLALAQASNSPGALALLLGLLSLPVVVVRRLSRRFAQRSENRRS